MYATYYSPSELLVKDTVWKDFTVKKKIPLLLHNLQHNINPIQTASKLFFALNTVNV